MGVYLFTCLIARMTTNFLNRGEVFVVSKEEPNLQMYIKDGFEEMLERVMDAENKLLITPVIYNDNIEARVLQSLRGNIYAIKVAGMRL